MIELLAGAAAVLAVVEGVQSVSYAACGLGRLAMRAVVRRNR
ncbi:MAG TPA: hypothetical protein VFJ16_24225 [Longimicrobium sp.]|nr:hypothetical protein [Longimicrobium sp.]